MRRLARGSSIFNLVACGFWFWCPALTAQVNVLTYHNDNSRTGLNASEQILTPANVNVNLFGKLFSVAVDGYVYAQPLVLTNVNIPGQGTHNVVYIATEHDSLYAIDADDGTVRWQVSFINPAAGITTVSINDLPCSDLVPEVGITGTPVIDPTTGTIYLVTKSKENGGFVQRLHAIDVANHTEKFGGPVVIQATVPGTGDDSIGGHVIFDPRTQNQRPGLMLQNNHIIISWASHCDKGPYHGWIISYDALSLAQEAVFNTSPDGGLAGVWMGGAAPAADANFHTYLATGNGSFDGKIDFGNSILKLDQPLNGFFLLLDWFTPFNQASLNNGDTDLGSGGVLLLPDLPAGSPHPHLLVQASKEGIIYLIDRDNMGHYCSTCTISDTQIVQEIPHAIKAMWGVPAYWNGNLYFGGSQDNGDADNLKAFSFNANNSGLLSTTPVSKSAQTFGFPSPTPSVSANGMSNGIVWALENSGFTSSCCQISHPYCCQILHAFDALNLATELYNSSQAANGRDALGRAVKFSVPTVANGKVYVGSQGKLSAFGIMNSPPTLAMPTFSPAPGTYNSPKVISISYPSSTGATIYYTTDGSTPTTSSSIYAAPITVSTTTTIKAIGVKTGSSNSPVATGTYIILLQENDFNGDGMADILWRNNTTGEDVIWLMNGTALSGSVPLRTVPDPNWRIVGTGDFNGDGKPDLLWRNTATGQNAVWFMNGTTFADYAYLTSVPDQNWKIVGTGDFNGDGKVDLLWRNIETGQNAVWFMNGTTFADYAYLISIPDPNWRIVGTGDFNGDGKPDLLWRNTATGQNAVWFMNGTTFADYAYLTSVPDQNWKIVGTGDFNGDGKVDLLWRNTETGQNAVWFMNGPIFMGYAYLDAIPDTSWTIGNAE